MKKLLANLLLAVVYCYSYAQTEPVSGQQDLNTTTSFSEWNQSENEVVFNTSTVDAAQIQLMNPQTTADLLGYSGNAFIVKNQLCGGSPLIRGFSTNRQLYLVDGVRLSNAISQSMNLNNMISLDPYSLESARIQFGPASVSSGSDAIGGAICFNTLEAAYSENGKTSLKGNVLTRYSTANGEISGHLDFNAGWEKWALLTSVSQYHFDDLRMGSHGPDEYLRKYLVERHDGSDQAVLNKNPLVQAPSGYSQINLMQKVQFRPNANWDVQYGFYLSSTTGIPRYDMLQMTSDSLPVMAESSFGPQLWIMNTINAGYSCPSTFCDKVDLRVSHQYFENSRTDRQFNDTTRRQQEEQINSMAVSFNLVKHLKENHRLTYGMEVIYDQVRSSGTGENIVTGETVSGMGCYPRAGWGSYGLYLDYLLNVNEKINIEAGVRYNLYQLDADFDTSFISLPYSVAYVNNDAMTGCIGVTWQPGKQWQLNLSFSTGFRSPNVDDIGRLSGSENGTVIVPNPSLESEYAYNAETGFSKIFGNRLKIDMTGYFTWLSRALVCRDFRFNRQDSIDYNGGLSKVQAVQNARRAMVYGLQAGMELRLPAGFGVISRFNWQQGTEELIDGSLSPMRHAAPWFGRAGLTYSSARLSGEFYAAFSGQVSFDHLPPEELDRAYLYALDQEGNPYSPAWCTINLKASYRLSRILSLSGGLENITDKRYRPYSSGISSPGVNFILSLRAGF